MNLSKNDTKSAQLAHACTQKHRVTRLQLHLLTLSVSLEPWPEVGCCTCCRFEMTVGDIPQQWQPGPSLTPEPKQDKGLPNFPPVLPLCGANHVPQRKCLRVIHSWLVGR